MVVVLPTPFTPTTIITYGSLEDGVSKFEISSILFSDNISIISFLSKLFNSLIPTYFSFLTLSSNLSIIFRVVLTLTSEETNTSSRLSKTSSSTLDFPATVVAILEKKLFLVFSKP